eukprot:16255299-Heterocapsa_arctica.AAC.1
MVEATISAMAAIGLGDPDPTLDEDDGHKELEPEFEHAQAASPEPMATAPSVLVQARYCLTHLSFSKWCPIYVKARAADQPHGVHSDQPSPEVVQFDCSFLDTASVSC